MAVTFPRRVIAGTELGMPADHGGALGFARIRVAEDRRDTVALLIQASRAALADAGCTTGDIDLVIAIRNATFPELEGAWLSLIAARELGIAEPACLDVKGSGCAGVVQGLDLAAAMLGRHRRILLLGGGAAGYRRRWIANPSFTPGELVAHDVALDPGMAESQYLDGSDCIQYEDQVRTWLYRTSAIWTARTMSRVLSRVDASPPMLFVGSNAGVEIKTRFCRSVVAEELHGRWREALDVQLAGLRELGHVFGGEVIANLQAIRDADAIRDGDRILAVESGDAYLFSAAVLRAR
jgi:hypothetical protein